LAYLDFSHGDIVGDLYDWFVDPSVGDLHLTDKAIGAIGQAVPLSEVEEDFDEQTRKTWPDVGANEVKYSRLKR